MIIDIHTHIFPPEFIRNRAKLTRIDSQFADIYDDKTALMATERDLLDSMEIAGVDVALRAGGVVVCLVAAIGAFWVRRIAFHTGGAT